MAIKYMVKGFESLDSAKAWVKEKGYGVIYTNLPHSKTQKDWAVSCEMIGLDKEKNPVTVNWNENIK